MTFQYYMSDTDGLIWELTSHNQCVALVVIVVDMLWVGSVSV
jgi:hypothetical protein